MRKGGGGRGGEGKSHGDREIESVSESSKVREDGRGERGKK